ncbi:MAG: arginase family protein [Gammaproteobacteria bacterium]|nr:arginase family protein [Gammaproteobacteria bacterium]
MMKTALVTVNSALGGPLRNQSPVSDRLYKSSAFRQLMTLNSIQHIDLYPQPALQRELQISRLNRLISQLSQQCVLKRQKFMVLSSDHSCAMGTWAGVLNGLKPGSRLGLIWLDAHLDAHTFNTSPSGNCHGMPVAALLGSTDNRLQRLYPSTRTISAAQLVLIGARSYEKSELNFLQQTCATVITDNQFTDFKQTFKQCFQGLDRTCTHIGISLDIDLINPDNAPAVATPVSGGVSDSVILQCLSEIAEHPKWCGFECAEWIPDADHNHQTFDLILKLIKLYCVDSGRIDHIFQPLHQQSAKESSL